MLVKFVRLDEEQNRDVYVNPIAVAKLEEFNPNATTISFIREAEIVARGTLDEVAFKLCGAMGPTKLDDVVKAAAQAERNKAREDFMRLVVQRETIQTKTPPVIEFTPLTEVAPAYPSPGPTSLIRIQDKHMDKFNKNPKGGAYYFGEGNVLCWVPLREKFDDGIGPWNVVNLANLRDDKANLEREVERLSHNEQALLAQVSSPRAKNMANENSELHAIVKNMLNENAQLHERNRQLEHDVAILRGVIEKCDPVIRLAAKGWGGEMGDASRKILEIPAFKWWPIKRESEKK